MVERFKKAEEKLKKGEKALQASVFTSVQSPEAIPASDASSSSSGSASKEDPAHASAFSSNNLAVEVPATGQQVEVVEGPFIAEVETVHAQPALSDSFALPAGQLPTNVVSYEVGVIVRGCNLFIGSPASRATVRIFRWWRRRWMRWRMWRWVWRRMRWRRHRSSCASVGGSAELSKFFGTATR